METRQPTAIRILIAVGFAISCFALALFLWVAFGGPVPLASEGYRVHVPFDEATQLAQESDVRISGVSVGKVKLIELNDEGQAEATIELDSSFAPIPTDTTATLRQKTLLGETYVELSPGTKDGPMLADGGELADGQVSPTVELDEIFRAFDAKTREAFRVWMDQQGRAFRGRGDRRLAGRPPLPGLVQSVQRRFSAADRFVNLVTWIWAAGAGEVRAEGRKLTRDFEEASFSGQHRTGFDAAREQAEPAAVRVDRVHAQLAQGHVQRRRRTRIVFAAPFA
jgi:hypothetical protein